MDAKILQPKKIIAWADTLRFFVVRSFIIGG